MLGSEIEESTCFQSQFLTVLKQHRTTQKYIVLYSITAVNVCAEGADLRTDRKLKRKERTCKLEMEQRADLQNSKVKWD